MKKTKKIIAFLMAALMLFIFTGCRNNPGQWISEKDYYYVDENGNWTSIAQDAINDLQNTTDDATVDTSSDATVSQETSLDTSKFQIITDYMGNDEYDFTFDRNNMYIESIHADVLEDDFRMRRLNMGEAHVTYKVDHIGEFIVQYSYGIGDRNGAVLSFLVSKDGESWTEVTPKYTAYNTFNGDSWMRYVSYFGGIDTENQYLKIKINNGGSYVFNPNLNFVQINGVTEKLLDELGAYAPGISKEKTIYVDSKSGKDTNDGTKENPLKSLYAASQKSYTPGSKILLKAGCTFSGSLEIKGSGNESKPITVTSYGSGEKPVITARGGSAIKATGEYITITGLKITNKTGRRGIDFTVCKPGATKGISVTKCDFEDINVNFTSTDKDSTGVYLKVTGRQPAWFDGVTVEGNTFNHVARCGIVLTTDWCSRVLTQKWGNRNDAASGERFGCKNVVIRNNKLNDIGGDGIFIVGCDGALVEKNVVSNSGLFKDVGKVAWAAIWCHSSDDCVFQYNEVYGNSGRNSGGDLQAFDADIACRNNIFQYNYSHDNDGGFMLLCSNDAIENGPGTATTGTIVRYNLSVNDGAEGRSVFDITSSIYDSQIYNNTIYCGKNNVDLVRFSNYDGGTDQSRNTVFTNNIFYAKQGVKIQVGLNKYKSATFNNNVFYNITPPSATGITVNGVFTEDPGFVAVGATGNGLKELAAKYTLKSGSYALSKGIAVANNGGKDLLGNKVTDKLLGAIVK